MDVGPEDKVEPREAPDQGDPGLRPWIEYLRDMGIYDLYRRPAASLELSEAARARLLAAAEVVVAKPAPSPRGGPSVAREVGPASRPGTSATGSDRGPGPSAPARPPATPHAAGARAVPPAAATSAPTYFPTDTESTQALPPELLAPMPKPKPLETLAAPAGLVAPERRQQALEGIRAEIGDCTRCPLAYAGRHTIVFGEGDPNAKLMFVGEGPGADEDASGQPFVGKAGQLLNNMIGAMGLQREQVYIANIVKCRPPANRTPEFAEATTCSQFLLQQIDVIRPQVLVALGSTAATYVLGVNQSLASLRGQWFACRGAKVAVTYHPAYLLRDPRQKAEAWKDLQRVMAELGLRPPTRT